MRYCVKCLMPETRPRIKFNKEGVCNGCEWNEKKKSAIDWDKRGIELIKFCDKYRIKDGSNWDVMIPCSFGKDSYHIAWSFKQLGMHPLLVYVAPQIPTKIGLKNKEILMSHGFDALQIDINPKVYWELTKRGFVEEGAPQAAFEGAISAAPLTLAIKLGIHLIVYGEEGESEYGGDEGLREQAVFSRKWVIDKYLRGRDPIKVYAKDGITKDDLKWWRIPLEIEIKKAKLFITHWSYFENWDAHQHRDTALSLGFKTVGNWYVYHKLVKDFNVTGKGTFTNYTSLDDPYMRTFHTYLMFLKFGWGRGSQEATNDIRLGAMTREEGLEMAKKYDDYDCRDFKDKLLRRLVMREEEFDETIDKWANKDILRKVDGKWILKEAPN